MRSTSFITADRQVAQGVVDVSDHGIAAGLDPAPTCASTRLGDVVLARVA